VQTSSSRLSFSHGSTWQLMGVHSTMAGATQKSESVNAQNGWYSRNTIHGVNFLVSTSSRGMLSWGSPIAWCFSSKVAATQYSLLVSSLSFTFSVPYLCLLESPPEWTIYNNYLVSL
jgi:hypothetical protein